MSKFYGIGAGPGDSGLVTVKAVKILEKLDILYTPQAKKGGRSFAHEIVCEYLPSDLEVKERHFPMSFNQDELNEAWDSIAREIEEDVKAGKNVGFVTLGDPMVYSTYIYLLKRLTHIETETIPGITSFLNIASTQNVPLVEGENPLVILPCTMELSELKEQIAKNNSLVLMKVYKNFKEVVAIIKDLGIEKHAILVSESGTKNEKVYKNILEIESQEEISYFSTILINKGWDY